MARHKPEVVGTGPTPPVQFNLRVALLVGAVAILLIWFVKGGPAYTVAPDEEGIVQTFGRYTKSTEPGFHFKLPWPIQTVTKPTVAEVKRMEFGFRSFGEGESATYRSFMDDASLLKEAQMLTGDENVVDCSMAIQYRITDARKYLFNYDDNGVEQTLQDLGEAALRQAVGDHPIDDVLTTGKFEVQTEIKDKLQEIVEQYKMGITITELRLQDVQPPREVAGAFKDVATAREEREQFINEARAYQRERVPIAQGEAERVRQEAEGYKQARIAEAEGAVARFLAIAEQHKASPEITEARLYLEAMQKLLPKMKVTIVDEEAGIVNLKNLGGDGQKAPAKPPAEEAPPPRRTSTTNRGTTTR